MRSEYMIFAALAGASVLASASQADAAFPTKYTDPATFQAQGVIDHVMGFDSLSETTVTGGPFYMAVYPIAFSAPVNLFYGKLNPVAPLVRNAYGAPVGAFVNLGFQDPVFDLLYINFAGGLGPDNFTAVLETNAGLSGALLSGPWGKQEFGFVGFKAPAGEHFLSLNLMANSQNNIPLISEIGLGHTVVTGGGGGNNPLCDRIGGCTPTAVPEPGTWALMILGFGAIGSALRAARRRTGLSPA